MTRLLWGPAHCNCQIYFEFDADLPPEKQVMTGIEVPPNTVPEHEKGTVRCNAHKHHSHPHAHYEAVLEESQRREDARNVIMNHLAQNNHLHMMFNEQNKAWDLHPDVEFHSEFDEGEPRHLKVDLRTVADKKSSLDQETKKTIESKIEQEITTVCKAYHLPHDSKKVSLLSS